jgi:hypothetical protein
MAAPLGFKTFATGDVLTAADTNGYLMQGVWVFANAAARTAAVTSPQEGNMSFLKDTNSTEYYDGSAWVAVAGTSGGMTLLSTTALGTSTTTVTGISGAYNKLFVEIIDCNPGVAYGLVLRFNSDATSNAYQGVYDYYPADVTSNSQRAPFVNKDTFYYICYGTMAAADNNNYSYFEVDNYANSNVRKVLSSVSGYKNSGGNEVIERGSGFWNNAAAITSLSIIGNGTFTGGTIKIWGEK